jgi:hypothetical protein
MPGSRSAAWSARLKALVPLIAALIAALSRHPELAVAFARASSSLSAVVLRQ